MLIYSIIIYATMLTFGLVENIKGVSFPLIKAEFGVAYTQQGGLASFTWYGYVVFCLIASLFMHRFGTKKAVLMGYALISMGALATLASPTFWAASISLLIINAGFGFFEVGANAMATVVFTTRAALMMNLMHFFYGLGAVLGPKAAGVLTNSYDFSWRHVYIIVLMPLVVLSVFTWRTRFDETPSTPQGEASVPRVSLADALASPIVWLFALTLGFMEVIEFGAANWGGLHLQDVYGLDPRVAGASFVSAFYVLFTVSRLFSGLAIERIGYIRSMNLATAASLTLFAVGFGLGRHGLWLLPVTGFFIAIMWPTLMAIAMEVFGTNTPTTTSIIITLSGAINGLFQLVIGLTNDYAGVAWGYRSCTLYAAVAFVLMRMLTQRVRSARDSSS
jgi:fucose permease